MQPIISVHMWVSLPNEVRWRISRLFNIPRSSNVVVNDGKIETDGTTNEDLQHLTVEKMQGFLQETSTDFHKLFDKTVAKITEELLGKKSEDVVVSSDQPVNIVIETKRRGRPKKNAKK